MTKEAPFMDNKVGAWLRHIEQLSVTIGARGSGTVDEQKAAEYCEGEFKAMGYEPTVEKFISQSSVFRPHLIAAVAFSTAYAIFPKMPGTAFVVSLIALISEVQELLLRPNLLRLFGAKNLSRNVFAKSEPFGNHRRDLILMGHMDTQRTPMIFSSKRWRKVYAVWSNVAMGLLVLQTVLFGAALIWPAHSKLIWNVTFISLLAAMSLIAITIEADSTPFTRGANDNATGAGLVLTFAELLKKAPLEGTRVWLVCSGSEESLHEGAVDFFKRHKKEFVDPVTVNFEMLGCAGPSYIAREGLLLPLRPDRKLLELVEGVGREMDFEVYPSSLTGGCTEASDSIINGIPAITLIGLERDGFAPHWHMPSDTFDKMDRDTLDRALRFAERVVMKLDKLY